MEPAHAQKDDSEKPAGNGNRREKVAKAVGHRKHNLSHTGNKEFLVPETTGVVLATHRTAHSISGRQ